MELTSCHVKMASNDIDPTSSHAKTTSNNIKQTSRHTKIASNKKNTDNEQDSNTQKLTIINKLQ